MDPKLNTTEQHEIYRDYKQSPTNILNNQLHSKTHTLFDIITHDKHTAPTTVNRKTNHIAVSSTMTTKQ
jgi:hypothetical protein